MHLRSRTLLMEAAMCQQFFRTGLLCIALIACVTRPARAAWPMSPLANLPVCTAAGNQSNPVIVSDGNSGAIIAWDDTRGATPDIYVQHVLASGSVDPALPANGRALCTAAGFQNFPRIVSDGAHGAIVTWTDYRSGVAADIYAQHVTAAGAVDPAWPVNGRAICTALSNQVDPMMVSDGAGGAIITWDDSRSGPHDIYAQRVRASGAVDPAWPFNGRAICNATSDQFTPAIATDGAGGAIITWRDLRNLTSYDIYAQHVLAGGAVDPAWPVNGRALCVATGDQYLPAIVADGAGGGIVAWQDNRVIGSDIYAQHVMASGAVDAAWPANGLGICTFALDQISPKIVADGTGGAIITWPDLRPGSGYYDIYAQHVLVSGAVDGTWPADGRALCTDAADQSEPVIATDGGGGAIVVWWDQRVPYDVYAQRVMSSGAVAASWPVDGRAVCTAPGGQGPPQIVADGTGGAIIAWGDSRSDVDLDIYAQRVLPNGMLGGDDPTPVLLSLASVEADSRSVSLRWFASGSSGAIATVYRRTPDAPWLDVARVAVDGSGWIRYQDRSVEPGNRYGYTVAVEDGAVEVRVAEAWVIVPRNVALAIDGVTPDPFDRDLLVAFSLPGEGPATLELLDLSGRVVMHRGVNTAPGRQTLRLQQGRAIGAGIYFLRLSQSGRSVTHRVCAVH
jgi:hypothetical protein